MNYVSGQIIEARCSRCKDVTGHNVVVCIDGLPAKVECRACGSVHKFVPPTRVKKTERTVLIRSKKAEEVSSGTAKRVKVAVVSGTTAKAESRKKNKEIDTESKWTELINSCFSQPVPYSMTSAFQKNSLVQHPTFGLGFVLEILPENKMNVFFRDGIHCLRCA